MDEEAEEEEVTKEAKNKEELEGQTEQEDAVIVDVENKDWQDARKSNEDRKGRRRMNRRKP